MFFFTVQLYKRRTKKLLIAEHHLIKMKGEIVNFSVIRK